MQDSGGDKNLNKFDLTTKVALTKDNKGGTTATLHPQFRTMQPMRVVTIPSSSTGAQIIQTQLVPQVQTMIKQGTNLVFLPFFGFLTNFIHSGQSNHRFPSRYPNFLLTKRSNDRHKHSSASWINAHPWLNTPLNSYKHHAVLCTHNWLASRPKFVSYGNFNPSRWHLGVR